MALLSVDFSGVPGEVLAYVPLQYDLFYSTPRRFVADPEIVVLTNGQYLAAYAESGRSSSSGTSGVTSLFRSADKGLTWISLGNLNGILRGSLFVRDGAVYLFGSSKDVSPNNVVVMKSTDSGTTWSSAAFTTALSGPATPNNPVVWSSRIWSGTSTSDYSASTDSNLLVQASWKLTGGFPAYEPGWPSEGEFIGEGQIVASPELGVFVLPKVKQHALTALARVSLAGAVTFDPVNNFASLPGGEKKFGAAYDAGSGKFFVLSNPILPAHAGSDIPADMMRNTAAVLTSKDLLNWKVEKLFLYSTDERREGFGYLNFDFDDTNMVVISRTAFKLPGETYPDDGRGGHDSNLLNFHRLDDFRNLSPNQYLKISGNQVLRYERTQHQDAPLGSFTLGSTFAGAALTAPNGLGQTAGGEVYIRETGGRILHFDALGNFIETTNASPVSLSAGPINAKQPSAGECAWAGSGSGDWSELLNWYYWGRPDTAEETAVFGSAATSAATITLPQATQTWGFDTADNKEGWTVANASNTVVGAGLMQGAANTASSTVQIYRNDRFFYGSSVPEVRIRLRSDANCTVYFYWGTPAADTFASARRLSQSYTGNGAFQELVFPLAGNAGWDGKAITRIRFDPLVHLNGAAREFAVDSITVPKESCRVKGLRFRNANRYTLSGSDSLRIQAESGAGSLAVQLGGHTADVPLLLDSDTDASLAGGTSLHLKKGVSLNGKTLHVTGGGRLLLQGGLVMKGGVVAVNGNTPLTFTNNLTGSVLDGTFQFLPEGSFAPSVGSAFDLLDNQALLGAARFSQVSMPSLPVGMKWNTNALYSAGTVSVEAVQHALTVTTRHGTTSPAAGTSWLNYGSSNTVAVTDSPVLNGATQYVCTGWAGTGSAPASGTTTNTGRFALTSDSAVTWRWGTNYWLSTAATTGGSVTVPSGWKAHNANVQIAAAPAPYYHFTGWSGDAATAVSPLALVMSRAYSVTANFAANVTAETGTPEWWLAQYGLTDFSVDAMQDADRDGLATWQEFVAGTNPTNPASCFRISGAGLTPQGSSVIRWTSVSNRFYTLSRAEHLQAPFTALAGASNMPATPPENVYTNLLQYNTPSFYRISVHE